MTKELRSCPFCGGEAISYLRDIDMYGNFIYAAMCTGCGAMSYECLSEEQAIKAWNRREPLEDIVEQLEELSKYEVVEKKFEKAIEIVRGASNETD